MKELSVLEKAKDLCLALRDSQEFKNFQEAKEILISNPDAKDRWERYQRLVQKASEAEKANKQLDLEDRDDLRRMISSISFYPETARFSAAQQAYYGLVQQILNMIEAISDNRPLPSCSENKEKSPQCTGSCGDCGLG